MRGILVFGASGPLLILSSYPTIDDPDLLMKLEAKGIDRFMAWEASLDRCRDLYGYSYRDDMEDLAAHNDIRVLDTDGHRILMNFSLRDLGPGIVYEGQTASPIG
jgi:hypothetical protein